MYSCEKLFPDLVAAVDAANNTITDNITDLIDVKSGKKKLVCVRANTEQEFYTKFVTEEWTKITRELVFQSNCGYLGLSTIKEGVRIGQRLGSNREPISKVAEEETIDYLITKIAGEKRFEATAVASETITGILFEFVENCSCQLYSLFKRILINYTDRYKKRYTGMSKEQARIKFKEDFASFKAYIYDLLENLKPIRYNTLNKIGIELQNEEISPDIEPTESTASAMLTVDDILESEMKSQVGGASLDADIAINVDEPETATPMLEEEIETEITSMPEPEISIISSAPTSTNVITQEESEGAWNQNNLINAFNISTEIDNLIPDSLGAMKEFFVTLLVTYYDKIHPVIWCPIFAKICSNFFVYMPINKEEFYQFIASQLLLNSGPVILKILQMMRPLLNTEIQQKYNLTKLTYPLLTNKQVDLILNKILEDPMDYKILVNVSASVGHVVILRKVDMEDPMIVKIIKPLSIVQSCAEYNMLKNTFPKNTCEQNFIDNMIYAIGVELDANNEIQNIALGHEYYTDNYNNAFGFDTGHVITTLEVIEGIVREDCWYALAVTLAPGVPISKLVENDIIKGDTKFRASLHRCLDLLVYKFFFVLFDKGFYHGDLHAGNVFFSFQSKTLTLIDFGAVGKLDIFSEDPAVNVLLEVIIMSMFYNYDGVMNKLTEFVNKQCREKNGDSNNNINVSGTEYLTMYEIMKNYSRLAVSGYDKYVIMYQNNIDKIFNQERINEEAYDINEANEIVIGNNIYSYLDIVSKGQEAVVENTEELRTLSLESSGNKSFNEILIILFAFYAENNVNIAIKFSEIYEFQKAYTLLLGVLKQTQYDAYRMNYVMSQAILNCGHIGKLFYVERVVNIVKIFYREKEIYEKRRTGDFNN
jgi:hypothetical protein